MIVHEGKLVLYLTEVIIPRGNKKRRGESNAPIPLGKESILAHIKAIVDIWKNQTALKIHSHPHPRGGVLRSLLDNLDRNEIARKREAFEDRGANTLNDGYKSSQLELVGRYFLLSDDPSDLRNRLDFLLGHAILGRGESKRMLELPDLFSLECEGEGPTKCIAVVMTMNRGKTNQHGKLEYGAAMRHANVEVCSVGALALYFFLAMAHGWRALPGPVTPPELVQDPCP